VNCIIRNALVILRIGGVGKKHECIECNGSSVGVLSVARAMHQSDSSVDVGALKKRVRWRVGRLRPATPNGGRTEEGVRSLVG
jgi:hypothetical protein